MIPVIHTVCGKQVAWHNEDVGSRRESSSYVRMDGTSPKPYTVIRERCQHCEALITDPLHTLKLDFAKPLKRNA